jgi:hypothetical protein
MEDRYNANTNIIIYTNKHIQHMYPKVGMSEEAEGGGKEEKNNSG